MEKKIKESDITNLQVGQAIMVNNPLFGDETAYLCNILTDEEDGDKTSYCFLSSNAGDYTFKKKDLIRESDWNIRLIDETHEKFDKKLSNKAINFSNGFNEMIKKLDFLK